MKTTKLTGMIKLISKSFTMILFTAIFLSCDVLEEDMDLQKPITVTTDNEVFVRPFPAHANRMKRSFLPRFHKKRRWIAVK